MQLHKRDVVEAATAILDNYGIADLTMRRLARELNVSPGALYWHFANKQQLLGAVADRILEPAATDDAAWRVARPPLRDLPRACAMPCCRTPTAPSWCRPASRPVSRRPWRRSWPA